MRVFEMGFNCIRLRISVASQSYKFTIEGIEALIVSICSQGVLKLNYPSMIDRTRFL